MTHRYPQPDRSWEPSGQSAHKSPNHCATGLAASIALLGGWIICPHMAWADQSLLVAQQVVDGLPPPPPLIFGQETPAASGQSAPSVQVPQMSPSSAPFTQTAPAAASSASTAAQRYWVVVNGDSPLLLSQVQSVIANASVQEYQGQRFIQAGSFNDATQAQQQVASLASQGIGAQVVSVSGGSESAPAASSSQQVASQNVPPPDLLPVAPVPREVEFGQPPPPPPPEQPNNSAPNSPNSSDPSQSQSGASTRSYYVVVPGKSEDLAAISNQITRLGDGYGIAQLVQTSTTPRGPHVQVGPFANRRAATRWSDYLRHFGLDARVYYSR